MSIKTRFKITIYLFGTILIGIGLALIITHYQVYEIQKQSEIVFNISLKASELNYLSGYYLIYPESHQVVRWKSSFATFTNQIRNLDFDSPEEQMLIRNIRENSQRLKEIFEDIILVGLKLQHSNQKPVFFNISWSRLAIQNQSIISDTLRLSRLLLKKTNRLTLTRTLFLYLFFILLSLFLLVNYILNYKYIINSLDLFRSGVKIIGLGNLEFKIKQTRNDEIGEVINAFNQMVTELKHANNELINNRDKLEELVEERTAILVESEERFRTMADGTPVMIWVTNTKGEMEFINKAYREFFGVTIEEIKAKDWQASVHPEDTSTYIDSFFTSLQEHKKFHSRARMRRVDGQWRWIESYGKPRFSSDGKFLGIAGSSSDITARKSAEESLRQSEERYRTLFNTMTEGFAIDEIILDKNGKPCDLKYLEVNPAFETQTGLKASDIIGRTMIELFPNAEPFRYERYGKVVQTGEPLHFEEMFGPLKRWFEVKAYKIDERRLATLFVDNTERKKTELKLIEQAFVLSNISDAVVGYDRENRVTYWGPSAVRIFGYKENEVTGKCGLDVLRPTYTKETRKKLRDQLWNTGYLESEITYRHKDGRYIDTEVNSKLLKDINDYVIGHVSLIRDVSERKKALLILKNENIRLQELDRKKSEFISIVSHDLRTPLTSIMGFADTLMRKNLNLSEEQKETFIGYIQEESRRLGRLISDFLDLSKIEEGKLELKKRKTKIEQIINKAVGMFEMNKKEIRLITEYEKDMPNLNLDYDKMMQVLQNLLGNAIKYSPVKTKVIISAKKDSDTVIVSIKDEGPGIKNEEKEKIFQKFYRIFGDKDDEILGSGIGLSIAKAIIEMHGGKIWVEDNIDRGSTFKFSLTI